MAPTLLKIVVVAGLAYCGKKAYDYYYRHRAVARAVINQVNSEVQTVIDHVNDVIVDEVDDVTTIVSANAIDSSDNSGGVKRRVRSKAPFRAYLVKIGKAKFGLLRRTDANILCVRKYLYDNCILHGVLARHINDNVDFATELVFVPMRDELCKLALKHTSVVSDCHSVAAVLGLRFGDN